MEKEKFYFAPQVKVHTYEAKRLLCASGTETFYKDSDEEITE